MSFLHIARRLIALGQHVCGNWAFVAPPYRRQRKSNRRLGPISRPAWLRFPSLEPLEGRRMLAVTQTFVGGALVVNLGAPADVATLSIPNSGASNILQLTGTGFSTSTFTGVASVTINFGDANQTLTFNGTNPIGITGALVADTLGKGSADNLTFANTTTYAFGSASIFTGASLTPCSVDVNDSVSTTAGSLTIGTGAAATSPSIAFGGTGTVSATAGDINLSSNAALAIATPLSDATGTVRLVAAGGITQSAPISSTNLSTVNTASGNINLTTSNVVSGAFAGSNSAAGGQIVLDDLSTSLAIGSVTAAGAFAATTGITGTNILAVQNQGAITLNDTFSGLTAATIQSADSSVTVNATSSFTAGTVLDISANTTATLDANLSVASLTVQAITDIDLGAAMVTTTAGQSYSGPVLLTASAVLTDTSAVTPSMFTSAVDGAFSLTVNTPMTWMFEDKVGSLTPLASLSVSTGVNTMFSGTVCTTTGDQTFNGPFILVSNAVFTSLGGGDLSFQSSLDSIAVSPIGGGPRDLTLSTSGQIFLQGAIGSSQPLRSLTASGGGTTILSGDSVITTQTQTYQEGVQLAADTTLTSLSGGNIVFSSTIDSFSLKFPRALTINTSGMSQFGGVVGGQVPLSALTTDAASQTIFNIPTVSNAFSITTLGSQTYNDPVVLDANTSLDISTTGSLVFGSTVNALAAGQQGLNALIAGTATFAAGVGQSAPLAAVTVLTAAPLAISSPIASTGAISLTSGVLAAGPFPPQPRDLTLSAAAALTSTGGNITLAAGRNINVAGTVTVSVGTLLLKPNLDGAGGAATLSNSIHANAINAVGNGATGNGLLLAGGSTAAQVVVQQSNQSISGYGGPVVTYQNIQTLGLNMSATVANSLSVFGSATSSRAIVDPLIAGGFGPSSSPHGAAPAAGSLQEFQIASVANLQLIGGATADDLENYSPANGLLIGGTGNDTLIGGNNNLVGVSGITVIYGGGGQDTIVAGNNNTAAPFANYLYPDYSYNNGNPQLMLPPGGKSGGSVTGGIGNDLVIALGGETLIDLRNGIPPPQVSITSALSQGVMQAKNIDPPGQGGPFYISNDHQLNVLGTAGNDTISVFFDPTQPTQFMVDVNGTSQSFSTAQISNIQIDGSGGSDTTALSLPTGSTATLNPGSATVTGPAGDPFTLTVANSASIYANGNGGGSATLDVNGQSIVSMTSLWSSVADGSMSNFVGGFSQVTSNSSGAGNVAFLYGASSGTNTYAASPASVSMSGSGYQNQANMFPATYSVSASSADSASFIGGAGIANTFVSTPDYAYMIGTGYDNTTVFFQSVTATAAGAGDVAYLYDGPTTQDTFTASLGGATPVASLMGPQFSSQVQGFPTVLAVSRGGNDQATFNDTSPSATDEFFAVGDVASLFSPATDPDLSYSALGFSDVTANASSSSDELHTASPSYALHPSGGWLNV